MKITKSKLISHVLLVNSIAIYTQACRQSISRAVVKLKTGALLQHDKMKTMHF